MRLGLIRAVTVWRSRVFLLVMVEAGLYALWSVGTFVEGGEEVASSYPILDLAVNTTLRQGGQFGVTGVDAGI